MLWWQADTIDDDSTSPVTAMLTRCNKKTVTVMTDPGRQWNVLPGLISRAVRAGAATSDEPNVRVSRRFERGPAEARGTDNLPQSRATSWGRTCQ